MIQPASSPTAPQRRLMGGERTDAPAAFHLLAKPTGAVCNLDCKYCFFLSKEMLYPGSRFRMADEMLETYIRQLLGVAGPGEVNVAWQGGEPTLMGLDFLRRSVDLAGTHKQSDKPLFIRFRPTARGLDDEWAAFFKEQNFLVGSQRRRPRGAPRYISSQQGRRRIFKQVMSGWEVLRRHDVEFNILCTVHAANADVPARDLPILPGRVWRRDSSSSSRSSSEPPPASSRMRTWDGALRSARTGRCTSRKEI